MALEVNESKQLKEISPDELPEYVPLVPIEVGERRLLLKTIQKREKTVSGIIIPESVQSSNTPTAIVVGVGQGVDNFEKGDIVYVNPTGGEFIEYDDMLFSVVFAGSVIARLTGVKVPVQENKNIEEENGNVS